MPRGLGDGTFSLEVVGGESCQPELEALTDNPLLEEETRIVLALLIPEDTNPYDRAAVRVQIVGRTVGYLSRADARALRASLGSEVQGTTRFRCRAKLQRLRFHMGGEVWTVRLDVCLSQE
jgi:hypothetical protein